MLFLLRFCSFSFLHLCMFSLLFVEFKKKLFCFSIFICLKSKEVGKSSCITYNDIVFYVNIIGLVHDTNRILW